jgi:hypothetical protein
MRRIEPLIAANYAVIALDLRRMKHGILVKDEAGGRSTSYSLAEVRA